jgi:hypothetical protein
MKIDDNLEEIFKLAYQQSPEKAEYYLTRIMLDMPEHITIEPENGNHLLEYMIGESSYTEKNEEKLKIKHLISTLRIIR